MINRDDIARAHALIEPYVRKTPVLDLGADAQLPAIVTAKLELTQHTGSFKARGAFNNLLSRTVPKAGVVAASGGNHGAAVAYAARALGYSAKIFVPEISSPVKIERVRSYGADIVVGGATYSEALEASVRWATENGALPLHAYDTAETVAGQGTMARELAGQTPDYDTILIAVGGGGFIGGAAAWIRDTARIVAVEPFKAPTLNQALKAGAPVDVKIGGIAADSLGASRIGEIAFGLAQKFVNETVLVSDADIRNTQHYLWTAARIVAEPGGATAMAAILSGAYVPDLGERVVVAVCGGNADLATLV